MQQGRLEFIAWNLAFTLLLQCSYVVANRVLTIGPVLSQQSQSDCTRGGGR